MGPGTPKALRRLGGVPLLVHAVRSLATARLVGLVVVAAPPDDVDDVAGLFADIELPADVRVLAGGETRQESVRRALDSLPEDVDVVLVHDAARPLAPAELADGVARAVHGGAEAVVPAVPVSDTVKEVDVAGRVVRTVDRSTLRAAQTPQGFRRETLARAHAEAARVGDLATDDAGLVERAGGQVVVVPGADEAFKVTRLADLAFAETVLAKQRSARGR